MPEISSLPLLLQERRLEHLTHTALHLIMGSRRRFAGIEFLKKSVSPTALEVAPAVWSARYFQVRLETKYLPICISNKSVGCRRTGSINVLHFFNTCELCEHKITEFSTHKTRSGTRSGSRHTSADAFTSSPVSTRSQNPCSRATDRLPSADRIKSCSRG